MFAALLALIVLVAIPYGTVEAWWVAAFECAIFALGTVWLSEGFVRGNWQMQEAHSLLWPPLLLASYAFLQTVSWPGADPGGVAGIEGGAWSAVSADPYATRRFAWKLLALILAGVLLLRYTSSRRRVRALLHVLIGVGVASALFGIMRQSFQRTPGFILPLLGYDPREYAQFISRNHFAFLMEMVFGLIAGLIVGRGVRRERLLLYVAALLIVWIALILANSRGGILSMLSQLIFTALMLTSFQPPRAAPDESEAARGGNRAWHLAGSLAGRVLLIASLLGAAVAGVVWVGGDPVVSRLETVSGEVSAEERGGLWKQGATRIQIWDATWELIKDHPFAGVGFGGYWTAITQYHRATGEVTPQEAHNDYLELAASGGIIGVALAVWFVVVFVRRVRQTLRASDPFRRAACLGALIGLFGVAVHSLVDFGLHITINALVFTALIAVAASNPAHETPLTSEANSLS